MMPPAPARLSTTTCCPTLSDIFCAISRATISVEPPGANPTRKRMDLDGKFCADAATVNNNVNKNIAALRMTSSRGGSDYPLKSGHPRSNSITALEERALGRFLRGFQLAPRIEDCAAAERSRICALIFHRTFEVRNRLALFFDAPRQAVETLQALDFLEVTEPRRLQRSSQHCQRF